MPAPATVFGCTSCRRQLGAGADDFDTPGQDFATALAERLGNDGTITVEPVECLAVCKRPLSIALAGEGRFMYVIGDLDPALHLEDVASASKAYAATTNGIVPWRQRPPTFRKGVIARIPPLGFKQPGPQHVMPGHDVNLALNKPDSKA
jgi:predicted metal-binding protein